MINTHKVSVHFTSKIPKYLEGGSPDDPYPSSLCNLMQNKPKT